MREAVGSYFLTTIFVIFVVLFTGYMCLSINMNKAYKVKNEIINIIQKNNGFDSNSLMQIQDYMTRIGYRTVGDCDAEKNEGFKGYGISGSASTSNRAVFCVKMMDTKYTSSNHTKVQFPEVAYYQVKVFFSVDLPIVRQFFTFGLKGSTKKLFYPKVMEG